MHWDGDATLDVFRQQIFRQSLRFSSENEEIALTKLHLVISASGLCRQEKITGRGSLTALQFAKRIPGPHVHFLPIIEPSSLEFAIVSREPKRLDQMERRIGRETKTADVSCVRRNFGLNQDDVEHGFSNRGSAYADATARQVTLMSRIENESGKQ